MKTSPPWSALLWCLIAAILTGCLGGSVDAAHRAAAKRIGVISLLGDEAHGHMAGLPAVLFAREGRAGSSADFGVDAAASASAIESLRAAYPGSTVVSVQSERDKFRLPDPAWSNVLDPRNIEGRRKALAEVGRQLVASHALDLLVVIAPWDGASGGAGQTPREPGYGLWTLSLFGAHVGDVSVFANFIVSAFDGTGKGIASKLASESKHVDNVPQHSSLDEYSTGQREQIAGAIREIVIKGTGTQLRHMNLVP